MIARFNSTDYNIVNRLSFKKSARQTEFSRVTIDFTGKTIADLPIKYQEVSIIDESTTLFTGYVDEFDFDTFETPHRKKFLSLSLLSPQTLLSKRTITIIKNNEALADVVEDVLSPLISDGFTIQYNGLSTTKKITIIERFITVEKLMNKLANDYNFVYYVDENKKIYIYAVDKLKSVNCDITLDNTYGYTLKPKISAVDYANVLNIKNQLTFETVDDQLTGTIINQYETAQLTYPISISMNTASKLADEQTQLFGDDPFTITLLLLEYNEPIETLSVSYSSTTGLITNEFTGSSVELITDPFNSSLITGIKNNGASITVLAVTSEATLIPTGITYYNANEIALNKDKVSSSGKIEKTLDLNNKFVTKTESLEIAKNQLLRTKTQTDEVELVFKGEPTITFKTFVNSIKPLCKMNISQPDYFVDGDFFVVDTTYSLINVNFLEYRVSLRNSNLLENYLDIFRKDEEEPTENDLTNIVYSVLADDEEIINKPKVLVDGVVISEFD